METNSHVYQTQIGLSKGGSAGRSIIINFSLSAGYKISYDTNDNEGD